MADLYIWNKGTLSKANSDSFNTSSKIGYIKGSQMYVVYPTLESPPDLFSCIHACKSITPFDWQLTPVDNMLPEFRLSLSLRGIL